MECVVAPLAPVTVIAYLPCEVDRAVATVRVELAAPPEMIATDIGLKAAVGPLPSAGVIVAVSLTVPAKPFRLVIVMV